MKIKGKLLATFLLFSFGIILILWILQVVLLDDVYRAIKIGSIRRASEEFDGMSDGLCREFLLEDLSSDSICVSVYSSNTEQIASEHAGGQCVVHNLSKSDVETLYDRTKDQKSLTFENYVPASEVVQLLKEREVPKSFYHYFFDFQEEKHPFQTSPEAYDSLLFGKIYHNENGQERFVLLSTVIVPVESTTKTIQFELFLISVALVLFSLVASFILSKNLSTPLMRLNEASKKLAEGEFDGAGICGYREVEEISQTLTDAAQEISQVDRLRQELIANVSHDLRTPLTLISGYSEVMRDIPGENTPENLQIIIDETHRLSTLVTDLMDLSKLQSGMEQIRCEKMDLYSHVQEACDRYQKFCRSEGFEIRILSDLKEVFVWADPVKIDQVIYNLIGNAINYSDNAKTVFVRLSVASGFALVEVIDQGKGIEKEKLPFIWDRYFRADQNHKTASHGTGLGLSIVKKVLTEHRAPFGVDSKIGQGSRFWFALPLTE